MPDYLSDSAGHAQAERSALAPICGTVPTVERPCPVCGTAMTGSKTSACSDRCRAAKSRRERAKQQAQRDSRLRGLAEAILRALG